MMKVLLLLVVIAVASALGVVQMKYRTRLLFSEVQRLQQLNEATDEELVQLQFQQNQWSERNRVQQEASGRLGMSLPGPASIISIQP